MFYITTSRKRAEAVQQAGWRVKVETLPGLGPLNGPPWKASEHVEYRMYRPEGAEPTARMQVDAPGGNYELAQYFPGLGWLLTPDGFDSGIRAESVRVLRVDGTEEVRRWPSDDFWAPA